MERNKQDRGQKVLIKEGWQKGNRGKGKKALQEHKLFCVKGPYVGKIMFLLQLIHSVKDTFQTTLHLRTEGLQSRARGNKVTEKITQAGDKVGGAANEMGKEKDILR